jgi:hypothetical protein
MWANRARKALSNGAPVASVSGMNTSTEFWVALRELAQEYDASGLTFAQRAERIAERFAQMPPNVRREAGQQLDTLAVALTDLAIRVSAARRRANAKLES